MRTLQFHKAGFLHDNNMIITVDSQAVILYSVLYLYR